MSKVVASALPVALEGLVKLPCIRQVSHNQAAIAQRPLFDVVPRVYLSHLNCLGVKLPYNNKDDLLEHKIGPRSENSLVRVAHWQPERTHALRKDMDWISV